MDSQVTIILSPIPAMVSDEQKERGDSLTTVQGMSQAACLTLRLSSDETGSHAERHDVITGGGQI